MEKPESTKAIPPPRTSSGGLRAWSVARHWSNNRKDRRHSSIGARVEKANVTVIFAYGIFGEHEVSTEHRGTERSKDAASYIQEWYGGLELKDELIPVSVGQATGVNSSKGAECVDRWFSDMAKSVNTTSPELIQLVLQNMGLDAHPLVRGALGELLEKPQILLPWFASANECLRASMLLGELACTIEGGYPWDLSSQKQKDALDYVVNLAVVLDRLTSTLLEDVATFPPIADVMINLRRTLVEFAVESVLGGHGWRLDLALGKYDGASLALQSIGQAFTENEDIKLRSLVQRSILSSVYRDLLVLRHSDPIARVGLALAATLYADSFTENSAVKWRVGREWSDTYTIWALTSVMGSDPLPLLVDVLIPSVSCAGHNSSHAEDFLATRLTAGALLAMHVYKSPSNSTMLAGDTESNIDEFMSMQSSMDLPVERKGVSLEMGEVCLRMSAIAHPSEDAVDSMLATFCGEECNDAPELGVTDSSPSAKLDDQQFAIYVGFIIWGTVVIAGLGLELLVWLMFLQGPWTKQAEDRWRLCQFLFPLLVLTAVTLANTHNFMSLPFMMSMYKFGFPETILYTYAALHDTDRSFVERLVDGMNGVGTCLHHSSVAFYASMILARVLPANRYTIDVALPLLMQHWFVLLKYVNKWLHIVIELILEAYAEWVALSVMEQLYSESWVASLHTGSMLSAHWLYLLAAGISLLISSGRTVGATEESKVRHLNEIGRVHRSIASSVCSKELRPAGLSREFRSVPNGLTIGENPIALPMREEEEEQDKATGNGY